MHKATIVGTSIVCASIAFAAQQGGQQQQQQRGGRPQSGAGGDMTDLQGPGQPMASLAGCEGPSMNWFTVVHAWPNCDSNGPPLVSWGAADVNGDGSLEHAYAGGGQLVNGGVPVPIVSVARLELVTRDGPSTGLVWSHVEASGIGDFLTGSPHFMTYAYLNDTNGLRDMDLDKDLDLVVTFAGTTGAGNHIWGLLWVENTGYEYNPPLAADVNGDGTVNGIDLASVLTAWSAQE